MVVLSDEEDDEELVDMTSAAAAQGILAGQMDPGFDEGDMRSKLCSIFNRIMDGYKIVNDAYVELWSIIDCLLLQILGKILSDVYMSATARTMQKEQVTMMIILMMTRRRRRSLLFSDFAKSWNFNHITSSPRYPKGNAHAQ